MNTRYKNSVLRDLRDQLVRFGTGKICLERADRAEDFLSKMNPEQEYTFGYLHNELTSFPTEFSADKVLQGKDIKHDLHLWVEDLSGVADVDVSTLNERIWTIEDLSEHFHVSTKTISRWRQNGLVARRYIVQGKKRVVFLDSSVQRFMQTENRRIERGTNFKKVSEEEKFQMIREARRLAQTGESSKETALTIAQKMGRSPETVRYILKAFDDNHSDISIFPERKTPLGNEARRMILLSFRQGMPVPLIARTFNRTQGSIYRIVGNEWIERIKNLPLDYIPNDTFLNIISQKDEDVICSRLYYPKSEEDKTVKQNRTRRKNNTFSEADVLPPYLEELYQYPLLTSAQEIWLFRKMNFLKYKASVLRDCLNPEKPENNLMSQIERLYHESLQVKNNIIESNLRLVVSIAKKHVNPQTELFDLISDGNLSLLKAVEKFDYSRGNKFSTYATWAIIRNFARTIPSEIKHRDRFPVLDSELFDLTEDSRSSIFQDEKLAFEQESQVSRFMLELDPRERQVISKRYGLEMEKEPMTLRQLGVEMGVTKERVRQIEMRALNKMRKVAEEEKFELPVLN